MRLSLDEIEEKIGWPGFFNEFKIALSRAFGARFKGARVYGSYARGENRAGSDLDVLVLLEEPMRGIDDLKALAKVTGPFEARLSVPLDALPAPARMFQRKERALYESIAREGVQL